MFKSEKRKVQKDKNEFLLTRKIIYYINSWYVFLILKRSKLNIMNVIGNIR